MHQMDASKGNSLGFTNKWKKYTSDIPELNLDNMITFSDGKVLHAVGHNPEESVWKLQNSFNGINNFTGHRRYYIIWNIFLTVRDDMLSKLGDLLTDKLLITERISSDLVGFQKNEPTKLLERKKPMLFLSAARIWQICGLD